MKTAQQSTKQMEIIMELAMTSRSISAKSLWTGRIISALVVLFMLFDSITKIMQVPAVMKASVQLGYTAGTISVIGIILFVCVVVYVIPRTSILGAVLLTGYLGGAVATNLRIGAPLFSNVLFPVYFGILVWAGLFMRNPHLRRFIPLIKID
ncbi:MAG TPA: DoxX family protein [Balneolales bacterium]|nr:DoxX family protein [Balneolales bacterium]